MRLQMPDGTSVLLVPHDDGVVVATQGAETRAGLPAPSGLLVTGSSAELLAALVDVVEETEVESVLGTPDETR